MSAFRQIAVPKSAFNLTHASILAFVVLRLILNLIFPDLENRESNTNFRSALDLLTFGATFLLGLLAARNFKLEIAFALCVRCIALLILYLSLMRVLINVLQQEQGMVVPHSGFAGNLFLFLADFLQYSLLCSVAATIGIAVSTLHQPLYFWHTVIALCVAIRLIANVVYPELDLRSQSSDTRLFVELLTFIVTLTLTWLAEQRMKIVLTFALYSAGMVAIINVLSELQGVRVDLGGALGNLIVFSFTFLLYLFLCSLAALSTLAFKSLYQRFRTVGQT